MQRKYTALAIVSGVYRFAGGLVCIASVALTVMVFLTSRRMYPYSSSGIDFMTALGTLIGGLLTGIALYAFGELLNLLRDLELNTRRSAAAAEETAQYTRHSAALLQQLIQSRNQQMSAQTSSMGDWNPR